MFRHLLIRILGLMWLVGVCFCNSHVVAQQGVPSATLTWKSGDAIPGHWAQADADTIGWQADSLFRDPVQIDVRYLSRIDFPVGNTETAQPKTNPNQEPYLIQLVNGGRMYGELKQMDATHVTLVAKRFGEAKILRDHIASLQNLGNVGQWTGGRFDLTQWESARGQKRFWQVNTQGQLMSTRQNIHLFREADLPASALIELELKWNKKLDFIFGLGVPRNARQTDNIPRLEAWDDSLVFSYGDNFEIVLESYRNAQHRIKLLIHWDQPNQRIAVHNESGQLLCAADLSHLKNQGKPGIYIENKTGDLIISEFIVRQSLPGFDSTKPSFQSVNEPANNGRIIDFDGQRWMIETDEKSDTESTSRISIPAQLFSNAFSINPASQDTPQQSRIEYADGMVVYGDLESFTGQTLCFNTDFTDEPLELRLANAQSIAFQSAAAPAGDQEFTHQMFTLAGAMRGRLEPGSQTFGDIIQWRLPGATASVPFAGADAKIVLQKRQSETSAGSEWPDTLYFYNRDRIPCRLVGIQDQVVHFESFTQHSHVDSKLLKAIDLESSYPDTEIGPQDSAWIIPEESKPLIEIKKHEFHLTAPATLSHRDLMTTGGFDFDFQWQPSTFGVVDLHLFGDSRRDDQGAITLQFSFYDNQVLVSTPGDTSRRSTVNIRDKAKLRVRVEDQKLRVEINDKPVLVQAVPASARLGRGVAFSVRKATESQFIGRLSNFQRLNIQGRSELGIGDSAQKELMLTIPRIRKNTPPQHILQAVNGDMLRGEIVSLDQEGIHFLANHQALRFPRTLISSLIWLHFKDLETSVAEPNGNQRPEPIGDNSDRDNDQAFGRPETNELRQTVQVLVTGDRRLTYDLTAWRENQLVGTSVALGECVIPLDQIDELRLGSFANQALDVPYSDWIAKLAPEPSIANGADADNREGLLFGTTSPLIGTKLSEIVIPTLDGDVFSLQSAAGKVVVLDFWATWCRPCVKAIPDLIAVTNDFSTDDVVLLAVNQEEDVATIRSFLAERDFNVQVGLDGGMLSRRLQVQSLPQTIVIGPDGKVAFVKVGYSSDLRETLRRAISSLLEE